MADRTVKAILKADVSSLVNGMKQAEKATSDFASKGVKSAGDHSQAWTQLGTGMMVTGAALALGVGLAVKAFADFDKEMSVVRAVSGATAGEMDKLRGAALKAGADTKYSASEAAKAEGELAKVGISTADILGGALLGSLNLAAAGNLDLGQAAEISGQAMKIFSLAGKDVGHIADVLASGANKSAADVTSLADAMKQGGLVAAQTGLTLEDTVGTLSAFADNALNGSDAGTSLKTMLQRLNPQSEQAAKLMDELGLRAYDASGNFVGITEYAGLLQTKLAGMTDEQRNATMQILFGSDAVRGANILYKEGAAGISEYVKAVNDNGAAARVAAIQMDNLAGDVEQLKGSIETALIQAGSGGNAVLRDMTQFATGAVNAFGGLPAPLQQGALGLTAVAAAGLLAVGGFMTVLPKIASTKAAMVELGLASKLTRANLMSVATGPIGLAIAGITLAVGLFAKSQMEAASRADDLRGSLDQVTGAMTDQTKAIAAKQLQDGGAFKSARELGIALEEVNKAALGSKPAMDALRLGAAAAAAEHYRDVNAVDAYRMAHGQLNQALGDQAFKSGELSNKYRLLVGSVGEVNATLSPQIVAVKEISEATGAATGKTGALAGAQTDLATETTKAKDAIDAEVQALQDSGLVVLSTRAATREFAQAQRDATEALKENGKSLADGTVKGDANAAVLDKMASSALGLADSIYKQTGSEDAMRASLIESRASLVKTYLQFDNNIGRANAYADSIIKIPAHKKTDVELEKEVAAARIKAIQAQIDAIRGKKVTADVDTQHAADVVRALQQQIDNLHNKTVTMTVISVSPANRAGGGQVFGAGTTTSDSIPTMLSNKEYVVKAAAVDKYGVGMFDAINSMRFAAGGYAGSAQSASSGSAPMVDMGGVRADLAEQTQILRTLIPGFGAALDNHAHTIQTMQRQNR